ncbi:DegT/DnrJ/EryC1/StrS aminotransferase family protein [Thioalkalivibrio sp. XN8]|uniref:DegT/DnrJ/EryC1/StrS family aminotransferase n=1 Tax=Thioalkalivibrio sp. XN8 TaxID=2712863 RepID=UPI0013ECFE42|nr:DegT/DnrJ/EryC1/StrS aminotransferase family protein [Thioalkalivibrio sp. XN8]NGP53788.1 DegT/DnrJ/EryC1/StrS aminotransferase family protein [Thioalkalivibrio sp. XN8]
MTAVSVPFFRPSIGDAEINAVLECLRGGWLTTGPQAAAFETEFSAMLGGGVHSVAVNSATAALHLALEALGVSQGDEVIVPTLTFTATAEVVRYLGAIPVFVDIDPNTLCLDTSAAGRAITSRTKVIMPVHFAGRPCDMTSLRRLADDHGLLIVDDAAHALPARHLGELIGSSTLGADVTAFSFYANKTMTTGEGGMLVTSREDVASRARKMRLHGIDRDVFDRFTNVKASWIYDVVDAGFKYNLTDLAAAIGRVQLGRINEFLDARRRLVDRYNMAFAELPVALPPPPAEGDSHSWHLYVLQLTEEAPLSRDDFIRSLQQHGVATSVHYRPLHQMTYWAQATSTGSFPRADKYFERCVSLPLYMSMTEVEQQRVVEVVCQTLTG